MYHPLVEKVHLKKRCHKTQKCTHSTRNMCSIQDAQTVQQYICKLQVALKFCNFLFSLEAAQVNGTFVSTIPQKRHICVKSCQKKVCSISEYQKTRKTRRLSYSSCFSYLPYLEEVTVKGVLEVRGKGQRACFLLSMIVHQS